MDHAKPLGIILQWLSTSLCQNPSCLAWPAGPRCAPSRAHWAYSPNLYWLTPVTLSHSGTTSIEGRAPGPPLLPAERRKDETIENFITVEYILTQKDIQILLFTQRGKKGRLRNCLCKMISTSLTHYLLSTYYLPDFLPATQLIAVNNTDQVPDFSSNPVSKLLSITIQPEEQRALPTSAASPAHVFLLPTSQLQKLLLLILECATFLPVFQPCCMLLPEMHYPHPSSQLNTPRISELMALSQGSLPWCPRIHAGPLPWSRDHNVMIYLHIC